NLASAGFTTHSVLPNGDPNKNITAALALNPDFIIVNLPTDDAASNYQVSETISNLIEVRNLAAEQWLPVFFTTTQPRDLGSTGRTRLQQGAEQIRAEFDEYVIDIYDELNDGTNRLKGMYDAGDGANVNNAGHSYIFSIAQAKLQNHLTAAS